MRVDNITGVAVLNKQLYQDGRGRFCEIYRQTDFSDFKCVQDNYSTSKKGVLRGLHYVTGGGQNQILTVIGGRILDFLVDLRKSSPTYLDYKITQMSHESFNQIYIPYYCAHGFLALTDEVYLHYKVDQYYSPDTDATINFYDKQIGIKIPEIGIPHILSEKDSNALEWKYHV